jgi:cell division protein FtsZ
MKSIVSAALERHKTEEALSAKIPEAQKEKELSDDDKELEDLIKRLHVQIKIVGCGGGGSNTINRCWDTGISGAVMCATNTDVRHLRSVHAHRKIVLGRNTTGGRGAGALPDLGEKATLESVDDLRKFVAGSHIVFVTAGLGGGTGTGGAPIVAKLAKETGALVIGVVTLPFKSEGPVRMQNAEYGLEKLARICDTTIVIPNDKLLELVPRLPLDAAFRVGDEVLMTCLKGMAEIITKTGIVNIDYSDILTIMRDGGVAMIGLGESESSTDKVAEAVNQALECPLLGDIDISGAKGALIRVIGGPDMTMIEAQRAVELVTSKLSPNARIIWGCSVEPDIEHKIKVLLVLTGVKSKYILGRGGAYAPEVAAADVDMIK